MQRSSMGIPLRCASCLTRCGAVLVVLALVAAGSGASAQDLEPRAYVNTPVGLNFLLAGYGYAAGGVATDPALPLQNARLHVHSTILAYARALDVWGTSGKVDVVVPYAWLSGSADVMGQSREREVSGFADPRVLQTGVGDLQGLGATDTGTRDGRHPLYRQRQLFRWQDPRAGAHLLRAG